MMNADPTPGPAGRLRAELKANAAKGDHEPVTDSSLTYGDLRAFAGTLLLGGHALAEMLRASEPHRQPDDGDTEMEITVDDARRIAWALIGHAPDRDDILARIRRATLSGGAGPDEARSAARTDVEPGCSTDDLPTPGEIRTINGQRCRFIEREIEGDKWEVLGPAPDAQQGEGAKPCHRDEALAALDWPRWSCPFGCPALFDPSPACPFHGDSTLEQALASAPSQQGEA